MNMKFVLSVVMMAAAFFLPQAHAQQAKAGDFRGVWLMEGGGGDKGNNTTPGAAAFRGRPQSQWSAEPLPFTPKGLAQYQSTKPGKGPRAVKPAFGNDPLGNANPPGLYRALSYARPVQIVQVPGMVIQLLEYGRVFRIIYTDGRPAPSDVVEAPFWYGYSVGRWEGDTLIVNTLGLDGRAWIDEWGTQLSDDARVEERWKRIGKDKLQFQITVDDPVYYTKRWTSPPMVYSLQPKTEPLEVIFSPLDEQAFNKAVRDPAGSTPKK